VITGDVDFENVSKNPLFITSVPGGVELTIRYLLKYLLARKMKVPKQLENTS
jgi:5,10-methylene-tetrahydrofolate dehydrogenase/methenyl tetrahydrofolate cyclohydrolase